MCNYLAIYFLLLTCIFVDTNEAYCNGETSSGTSHCIPLSSATPYPAVVYAAASALAYIEDEGTPKDGKNYADCLKIICGEGFSIIDEWSGDGYILIADKKRKNFILSFRGTAVWIDYLYDLSGFIGVIPDPYLDAPKLTKEIIEKLRQAYPESFASISLTGHSLGGGLAEYAAGKNGLHAVTFNSAHLSHQYVSKKEAHVDAFFDENDSVWAMRLGGTYDFVDFRPISCTDNIKDAHSIYSMVKCLKPPAPEAKMVTAPKPDTAKGQGKVFELLLESSPNLVDGLPSVLHSGMRVAAIKRQGEGINPPPIILDTAFRYGAIYDTAPEGGINIDSLRIFDLSQTKEVDTNPDIARDWRAALSFTFPLPDIKKLSVIATVDYQELDYHVEDEFDFDVLDFNLGVVWDDDFGGSKMNDSISTLSMVLQRYRNEDETVGVLVGSDAAISLIFDQKLMVWGHGVGGKLVKSDASGGDGYVIQGDVGLRQLFNDDSSSVQLRVFGGRREAEDDFFTNTQWGAGLAFYHEGSGSRKLTAFIEPSIRWNHHHLESTGDKSYADREYSLRMEVTCSLNCPPLGLEKVLAAFKGWDVSLGYTYSHNDLASDLQNFDRNQVLLQIDKKF